MGMATPDQIGSLDQKLFVFNHIVREKQSSTYQIGSGWKEFTIIHQKLENHQQTRRINC